MKKKTNETISVILAIVGLVFVIFPFFGALFSAAAISFSRKIKTQKTDLGKAGFIIGIIGLCLNLLLCMVVLVFFIYEGIKRGWF